MSNKKLVINQQLIQNIGNTNNKILPGETFDQYIKRMALLRAGK